MAADPLNDIVRLRVASVVRFGFDVLHRVEQHLGTEVVGQARVGHRDDQEDGSGAGVGCGV